MNYNNKLFRLVAKSQNGVINEQTFFRYHQEGRIVSCTYEGGKILKGQLIGWVDDMGNIDMRYHQIDAQGQIMTGICRSTPEMLQSGKIRLYENWQWTSGDCAAGHSIIEEVDG